MRVLVTRPGERTGQTAYHLRQRGHEVYLAPVLNVTRSGVPMPDGTFDALILTSPGALLAFDEPPIHLPVLAVGDRTAADARAAGFLHVLSAGGDRLDLAQLARDTLAPASRLLMAVGRERKEDLAELLREAGHDPVVWVCYHADAVDSLQPDAVSALAEGHIDCVMHYSGRSAAVFSALARAAGVLGAAQGVPQVCIAPDATIPLRAAGFTHVLAAGHPDEVGMLEALDALQTTGN